MRKVSKSNRDSNLPLTNGRLISHLVARCPHCQYINEFLYNNENDIIDGELNYFTNKCIFCENSYQVKIGDIKVIYDYDEFGGIFGDKIPE